MVATFHSAAVDPRTTSESSPAQREAPARTAHARGSRALIVAGAALLAGGVVMGTIGLTRVPANCSLSSHDCTAPPGDDAFSEAEKAVRWSNIGWASAGAGAAVLTAGLLWFFRSGKRSERELLPHITPTSAGLTLRGRL